MTNATVLRNRPVPSRRPAPPESLRWTGADELADPPTLRAGPHHADRLVLATHEWRWEA